MQNLQGCQINVYSVLRCVLLLMNIAGVLGKMFFAVMAAFCFIFM